MLCLQEEKTYHQSQHIICFRCTKCSLKVNILLCLQNTIRVYNLSQMCKSGFYLCILWFHSLLPFPLNLLAFKESLLQHQALGNEFTN